jgi:hypothetical protein
MTKTYLIGTGYLSSNIAKQIKNYKYLSKNSINHVKLSGDF